MTEKMKLDIISDTVCPWCYVGKKRIEKALDDFGPDKVDVMWRPYQLDPSVPREGVERKAYMQRKFGKGDHAKAALTNIVDAGAQEGIAFNFDIMAKYPNTIDSHRLIRWADSAGCQDQVVTLLFQRYFEQGQDIGDHEVLVGVAQEAGMDIALVADLLAKDADIDLVQKEDNLARQMGISGVPTMIVADRFGVTGAQDPAYILRVLNKAQTASEIEPPAAE